MILKIHVYIRLALKASAIIPFFEFQKTTSKKYDFLLALLLPGTLGLKTAQIQFANCPILQFENFLKFQL